MSLPSFKGFVEVNNGRFYVESHGQGNALVFIHGFGMDYREWHYQIDAFKHDYRLILYDRRGFGKSAPPTTEPYNHGEDLGAILNYLGIQHGVMIGSSRGGSTVLEMALLYPSMVDAIVTVDSVPDGFPRLEGINSNRIKNQITTNADKQGSKLWFEYKMFDGARRFPEAREILREQVMDYEGWHWFHDDPEVKLSPNLYDRVTEINKPALAVAGDMDLLDFRNAAVILGEKIPGAKYIQFKDTGHLPNMERPEEFNQILRDFLKGVYYKDL